MDRYDRVLESKAAWEEREDLRRDVEVRERDPRAAQLMREQLSELLRMHDAPLDEQLAEATLVDLWMTSVSRGRPV